MCIYHPCNAERDVLVPLHGEMMMTCQPGTGRRVDELLPTAAAILAVPLTASL